MMANNRIQALIWDAGSLNASQSDAKTLSEFILALHTFIRVALSGSSLDEIGMVLGQHWEIAPAIERLIVLPEAGDSPQPEIFAQAAGTLRAMPGETVWVGAHPAHIENARAAGLQTVFYSSAAQAGSELFEMFMA